MVFRPESTPKPATTVLFAEIRITADHFMPALEWQTLADAEGEVASRRHKSKSNFDKHGIDFETARLLWKDPFRMTAEANSDLESRFATIGSLNGIVWFAVFTIRDDRTRIISVRRARERERKIYENQ